MKEFIDFFVMMIVNGSAKIEDIPKEYQEEVKKIIENLK